MNRATERLGTNQHLVRSILAIRAEGGVSLGNDNRVMLDPGVANRHAAAMMAQYSIAWQASATAAPAHDINLRRTSHVPRIRNP
jgi:hypothetical protein